MTRTTLVRFAVTALALTASACAMPEMPHVGGGPLPLDALAVTQLDAETGNPGFKVLLDWPSAYNARIYQLNRKFGTNSAKLLASVQEETEYVDSAGLGANQSFSYQVRALSGDNKELTVSNFTPVTVLAQTVAKPTGLKPEDNAKLTVDEVPTFSWQAVPSASWYYVEVTSAAAGGARVWSALTKDTSVKFGAESPLTFSKYGQTFPVGSVSSLSPGVVHRWTVKAIRAEGAQVPDQAKAIDVNPSAPQTFSQS